MRIAVASALVCLAIASDARADVAVPGEHRVDYLFEVDNTSAFPSCAFFAYPYTLSNGAPTREYRELGPGAIPLGSRFFSPPKIYAMSRADYEQARTEGALPPPERSELFEGLEAFFASPRVHATAVTLDPPGWVKDNTGLVARRDVVHVKSCDANGAAEAALTGVEYRYKDGTTETKPYGTPPRVSGCAACAIGVRAHGERAPIALLVLAAALAARRRHAPK